MTYKLKCDNKHWVEATYNEEMEKVKQEVGDITDEQTGYYWVTSTERDEVLEVVDFTDAEDIVTELASDEGVNSFEQVVGKYEKTEIMEERPPYGR